MNTENNLFDEHEVIHQLKHYLPEQAALKDFIHQNTLQAFQKMKFHRAIQHASQMFGHSVSLKIEEFRALYKQGRIREDVLERIVKEKKGEELATLWKEKALHRKYLPVPSPRIGVLRSNWKRQYHIDMDSLVHPILFRILCSYLDQGISIWTFPVKGLGFLESLREMEKNSFASFFRKKKARKLLLDNNCEICDLLKTLVGDESLYKQYLFDQQFAHQGWSGMVSTVESNPQNLLDTKKISVHDLIVFELLLEIDAMDYHFGREWTPLANHIEKKPEDLFAEVKETEVREVISIWQEAFEWSYYDQVLAGIRWAPKVTNHQDSKKTFQALFCIDDREDSFRRYLEKADPQCETFATPGFFSVEFYYQPEEGKFYTKVCPAPINPKFLIKEVDKKGKRGQDAHFSKHATSFYSGFIFSQVLGFWSALKLAINIFRPSISPATALSFQHHDKFSHLTIENKSPDDKENGLQIGFTVPEMAQRLEGMLMSIGLVKDFAPIVYLVGHGSSSVNNPHYAQFMGGLHDTTRDEVMFYDEDLLTATNRELHHRNEKLFHSALDNNSKERSRRFVLLDSKLSPAKVHEEVKKRSVSLFEPRPELNHATNALCIVARRSLSKNLFLDRRAFHNSYNYAIDPDGKYLLNILRPAAPVCGGINLEYFFSRVDNQKLGAGTKLPHNVMGLFGVANGIDGDLRPGLPSQMIEVHDPVRLLMIVEHFPNVVLETIQRSPETYEWFINEWVHLIAVNPETYELSVFKNGQFYSYEPLTKEIDKVADVMPLFEEHEDNLPVYELA